ncbi:MAG: DUF2510 domain-containing protein [Actinomycetia bacterium]|nr:DUF2510 domain-containing protein [Actinomycetes bacterium]
MSTPQPGWYLDPWSTTHWRWFDGTDWTGHTEPMRQPAASQAPAAPMAVVDVETTGLGAADRIVEIAVVSIDATTGQVLDEFETLINPRRDVGPTSIHGVTASMVTDAPEFGDIAGIIAERFDGTVIAAHNLGFERRVLGSEFDNCGVALDWGAGFCTYAATGLKLSEACWVRGIELTGAHTALGDARATAQLAYQVWGDDDPAGYVQAAVSRAPRIAGTRLATRSSGRDTVDASTQRGFVAAIAKKVTGPGDRTGHENAEASYFELIDSVVEDFQVTGEERTALTELADNLDLDEPTVRVLHRMFVNECVNVAVDDDIVTDDELEALLRVAALLDVPADVVAQRVDSYRAMDVEVDLVEGLEVGFTGEAVIQVDGTDAVLEREDFEDLCSAAGLVPLSKSVRKKSTGLLVAADPESRSGTAGKARKFGIPITTSQAMFSAIQSGQPSVPARVMTADHLALVCTACGTSWLAKRRQSEPLCNSCKS